MAGSRKKGDYSVLAEINTEEDWDNLCSREVSNSSNGIFKLSSYQSKCFSLKQIFSTDKFFWLGPSTFVRQMRLYQNMRQNQIACFLTNNNYL